MHVQTALADPLLTEVQAAEELGVEPVTLQVWRSTRRYDLPYVKVGRLVRYRRSAIEQFLAARTVTDDAAPLAPARVKPPAEKTAGMTSREAACVLAFIDACQARGINTLDEARAAVVAASIPAQASGEPAKATTATGQGMGTPRAHKRRTSHVQPA
jgi:hypothetical protein